MNSLDDDLAKLFAVDESGTDDAAFVAAVGRRVAKRRLARRLGLAVIAAACVIGFALLVPGVALYPVQVLNELFGAPFVALTAVLGAIGVTWWTTFVEEA